MRTERTWNAVILGEGWVYACPQKTGTSSMRNWLTKHYDGEEIEPYHRQDVPDSHADSLVFMTVRNPYDRVRSYWRFRAARVGDMDTVEEVVASFLRHDLRLVDWRDNTNATVFLPLETINEAVTHLPFYREAGPRVPHLRRNRANRDWVLTDDDRRLIATELAEDFAAFGYAP